MTDIKTLPKAKTFPNTTEAGKKPSLAVLVESAIALNTTDKIAFTRVGDTVIQLGISEGDLNTSLATLTSNLQSWVNDTRPDTSTLGLDNVQNYGISDSYSLDSSTSYASSKAVNDAYAALQSWVNSTRPTRASLSIDNVQNYGISDLTNLDESNSYASSRAVAQLNSALTTKYDGLNATAVGRLDGLDVIVANHLSEINSAKTRLTNVEGRATALEASVAALESQDTAYGTAISDIQAVNATQASEIAALETLSASNQAANTTNASNIASNLSAINNNASEITTIKTRLDGHDTDTADNAAAIVVLQNSGTTDAANIASLTARVDTAEDDIDSLESATAANASAVATKAEAAALNAVDSRTGTLETKTATLESTMLTKANSSTVDIINTTLTSTTGRTTALEDRATSNEAAFAALVARTDNPHSVTADQVGLGNVANHGISDAIDIDSSASYASSKAVKTAYDRAVTGETDARAYTDEQVSILLGGAPQAALDTLTELGDALTANGDAIVTINESLATKATIASVDALTAVVTAQGSTAGALDLRVGQNETDIATIVAAVSSVTTRTTDSEAAIAALDTRTEALETKDAAKQVEIDNLTINSGTNTTAIATLVTRADDVDTVNAAHATSIADIESVNTTQGEAITSLTTRTTAVEAKDVAQDGRLTTNESAITALDTEVTAIKAVNTTQNTTLSSHTTDLAQHANAISTLESTQGTQQTTIDSNVSRLTATEAAIASIESSDTTMSEAVTANATQILANTSAISAADVIIAANKTRSEDNAAAIVTLQTRATDIEAVDATQNIRITAVEGDIVTDKAAIAALQTTTTNLSNDKADQTALDAHASATGNVHGLVKADIDLGNVQNFGISDSVSLDSSNSYASSKAVKTAYDRAVTGETDSKAYTDQKISDLMGGIPAAALDTIVELGAALSDNDSDIASINAVIATKASQADLDTLAATVGSSGSDLGDLRTEFDALVVTQKVPTEATFRNNQRTRTIELKGAGVVSYGRMLDNAEFTPVGDGLYVSNTKTDRVYFDAAVVNGGFGADNTTLVSLGGSLLSLQAHGNDIADGSNYIRLPAAPDGLDKADGTGRYANLAAAVTAGGADLTESIVNALDVTVLLKSAPGNELNVSTTGELYPYGNAQARHGISGIATTGSRTGTINKGGAWDTAEGKLYQVSSVTAGEWATLLAEEENNLFLNANDEVMQELHLFQTHRLVDDGEYDIHALMTRAGYTRIGNTMEYSITIDTIQYIAMPYLVTPRSNKGVGTAANLRGRGRAATDTPWSQNRDLVTVEDAFTPAKVLTNSGTLASAKSGDILEKGRFADVIYPEDVIDVRMCALDMTPEEVLSAEHKDIVLGNKKAISVMPISTIWDLPRDSSEARSGFVTGLGTGDVWELKMTLTEALSPALHDQPWVYDESFVAAYILNPEGGTIALDHVGQDPGNPLEVYVQVLKSKYDTNPLTEHIGGSLHLVVANKRARSIVGTTDSSVVTIGRLIDIESYVGQVVPGLVIAREANYHGNGGYPLVSRPLVGTVRTSTSSGAAWTDSTAAANIVTSKIDETVAHGDVFQITYEGTPVFSESSDVLAAKVTGDVLITSNYKTGAALAASIAGVSLAAPGWSHTEVPLTGLGTRDFNTGALVTDSSATPPSHVVFNRAIDIAFENDTQAIKVLPSLVEIDGAYATQYLYKTMKYDIGADDADVIEITAGSDTIDLGVNVMPKLFINTTDIPGLDGKVIQYTGNSFDTITLSELADYVLSSDNDNILDGSGQATDWDIWEGKEWGDNGLLEPTAHLANAENNNGMTVQKGTHVVKSKYYA